MCNNPIFMMIISIVFDRYVVFEHCNKNKNKMSLISNIISYELYYY